MLPSPLSAAEPCRACTLGSALTCRHSTQERFFPVTLASGFLFARHLAHN